VKHRSSVPEENIDIQLYRVAQKVSHQQMIIKSH